MYTITVLFHSREFLERFPVKTSFFQCVWQLLFSWRGMFTALSDHCKKSIFSISTGIHPSSVLSDTSQAQVSLCPSFSVRSDGNWWILQTRHFYNLSAWNWIGYGLAIKVLKGKFCISQKEKI